MFKTIAKFKVTRRQGESKAHYYTRLNKEANRLKGEFIAFIFMMIMVLGMVWVFLFGDDGQCRYSACDCPGYECNYHCEQHGHDCPEND